MAKKLPIFISTLTFLASSLSVASVGAISDTGPWSFDELTIAKNEVETEASTQCTDSATREACIEGIMDSKGGIYSTGLRSFLFNQFVPLSMNFATGELKYYHNSTNEYRKINNKRPYLKDYLTKLFIVQVEQGYDDWAADFEAGIKDSKHWRVLYDESITEEGTSLLPYDQKATLTINTPSFDPKYEKYLRVFYVNTFSNDVEINTYDFAECTEGRTCEAWHDATNPFFYFKDFNYTDGYNDGYGYGFDYGQLIGQADGYYGGYDTGYGDGYNNGYTDGYINGSNDSRTEGYGIGYDAGHDDGYSEGADDGHAAGYSEGYNAGHAVGYSEGYDAGYSEGHNTTLREIHLDDDGEDSSSTTSPDPNPSAPSTDTPTTEPTPAPELTLPTDSTPTDPATTDTVSSDSPSNNNPDTDTGASAPSKLTNVESPIIDSTTLSKASTTKLLASSTNTLKTELKSNSSSSDKTNLTPNTGMSTSESSSADFEWWLGLIFAAGIVTLIWLFLPRKAKKIKDKKISRSSIN